MKGQKCERDRSENLINNVNRSFVPCVTHGMTGKQSGAGAGLKYPCRGKERERERVGCVPVRRKCRFAGSMCTVYI